MWTGSVDAGSRFHRVLRRAAVPRGVAASPPFGARSPSGQVIADSSDEITRTMARDLLFLAQRTERSAAAALLMQQDI